MNTSKLKVLQLGKLYYPHTGGVERTMQQIAEGISKSAESYVLAAQSKGRRRIENVNGVSVYYAGSLGTIASMPISFDLILHLCRHASEFDVIHLHMPFPLGDIACLLSGFKGKLVVYWHSDIVRQKKLLILYKPFMERLLKRADVILIATEGNLAGSEYLKPYVEKCRFIPFSMTRKIEKSSDDYWKTKKTENDITEKSNLKLLFIGRLVYYKGCEVLMEAMKLLKGKPIELTMVGTGILEEKILDLMSKEHIENQINLKGWITDDEMIEELKHCDVFVFPSVANSEAFGLVQLEAMSFGKPVINTSLPTGVPYVSLNRETGLTVPPSNAPALADAIEWFLEHPKECEEMGQAARKRAKGEFNERLMIKRILEVYEEGL